jgi:hypothetical protein
VRGAAAIAISVAVCAVATSQPDIAFSQSGTGRDLVPCLQQQAQALDDGHSDAATIAKAVAGACQYIDRRMYDLAARALKVGPLVPGSPEDERMRTGLERDAIIFVLRARAAKAAQTK